MQKSPKEAKNRTEVFFFHKNEEMQWKVFDYKALSLKLFALYLLFYLFYLVNISHVY